MNPLEQFPGRITNETERPTESLFATAKEKN